MIFKINHLGVFFLVILLGLGAFNSPTRAQSNSHLKLDATRVSWTDISFHAKHFLVELSTDIQLRTLRASDLDAVLLKSPKGNPIKPVTPETAQMTVNTIIAPTFRSPVNIYNRIWFNPADASALGRVRLRRGEDDFKKNYRFTDQGVFRHRIEPRDKKEAPLDLEKWTDIDDSFYSYDPTRLGCSAITERALLIYILSAAAAGKFNGPLSLCVFGKRQLHQVQIRQHGRLALDIDYIEKKLQTVVRKKATIKTLKFTITAKPMDSDLDTVENFSFLGLRKDIIIYIDPTSGVPVQISGIIPAAGKAHLKLRAVSLAQKPN
jgi:hypothetical protein